MASRRLQCECRRCFDRIDELISLFLHRQHIEKTERRRKGGGGGKQKRKSKRSDVLHFNWGNAIFLSSMTSLSRDTNLVLFFFFLFLRYFLSLVSVVPWGRKKITPPQKNKIKKKSKKKNHYNHLCELYLTHIQNESRMLLSFLSPQWGATDAEINVLSAENLQLTNISLARTFFLVHFSTFPVHSPSFSHKISLHSLTASILANNSRAGE